MKKIECYSCSHAIELDNPEPLSKITCPECKNELTIPGVLGEFVLEEIISSNQNYKSYRGHSQKSDENLVIKVLNDSKAVTDQKLIKIKSTLLSVPEELRLTISKVDKQIVATRKYYETSLQRYLENNRPKTDKALYILKEAALILESFAKNEVYPVNLTIGNLLMDSNGKIILSDMLFKEAVSEALADENKEQLLTPHTLSTQFMETGKKTVKEPIFSFGCLAYLLCCGNYPWPFGSYKVVSKARNIQPAVILDLRGENSEEIKQFISDLINEKEPVFNSFDEVLTRVRMLSGEKVDAGNTKTKKKGKKKKATAKPTQAVLKPSPGSKAAVSVKRRRKQSSPILPIVAVLALLLIAGLFMKLSSGSNNASENVEVAEKAPKPEPVKKERKKTVTKPVQKKQEEPAVVDITPQKPIELEKPPEVKKVDREAIKADLLPNDLNFDPLIGKLDEYIAATEVSERTIEEKKIEIVCTFRDNLLVRFYRRPYQGIIYLNGQKPFRGKINKADENKILIQDIRTGKPVTVKWQDLDFNQFEEFTGYYVATYADEFSISENNDHMFKKVAEEYKRLAIFLDWYGFHDKAVSYKKKAISFHDEVIASLNELVREESTN